MLTSIIDEHGHTIPSVYNSRLMDQMQPSRPMSVTLHPISIMIVTLWILLGFFSCPFKNKALGPPELSFVALRLKRLGAPALHKACCSPSTATSIQWIFIGFLPLICKNFITLCTSVFVHCFFMAVIFCDVPYTCSQY